MSGVCRFLLLSLAVVLMAAAGSMGQSPEALMNTGQEMVQRGAFSQAVTAFRKALAQEPDFFEAQFNLAFAYLQWGRYTESVAEFKKALALQSKNSEVWSNLAIAYDNLNRQGDAMYALEQAVKYNPENTTARMNLAAMYANANKNAQAIVLYKQVIKVDGSNGEAYLNLSKCLIATKNVKEAKEYLKQAIANMPNKGDAHVELGTIYWKYDNDFDKGITEYRTAISIDPSNPAFYQELASALESKGKREEAAEELKKSLTYIDDALVKEKVQDRIDRLEKGSTGSGSASSGNGGQAASEQLQTQTKDLERELRGDGQKSSRRINPQTVNVSNDFADVAADTSSTWDIQKEAKKRAAKKSGK